ncbi:hypothetical protein P12x_001151 [Tundrisphaera lichenicola]|uniref:hypothetical protein n=1 Tax=Tundrisphaera lichenicola TaxID=2029860 RepID=UPI003EBE8965
MEDQAAEPSPKRKRPIGMMAAAITCWLIGTHLALPVPGVILYLLVDACLDDGWRNILSTLPGRLLLLMIVLSTASTVAWMTAGWQFFGVRGRQGKTHVLVAIGSEVLACLLFFFL